MSETSDEEADYGSFDESIANSPTDSDHAWSTSENDSQDYKWQGYIDDWNGQKEQIHFRGTWWGK